MAFVKPPARNMPPGSEPWAQWVEEQMSSVTKKSVEAYQYAERAAGGANSALEGNVQNWDEINRVFEVTENSMQLADGAVVWSTLDPEIPEDVPINPNVIWYTHDPETREVLRMWQWGYYDDVEGVYVEDWYQAQLGADSIHDEAITSAKVALGAIDWDQIAPDVENTVTTTQETAEKAAADLLIEKDRVNAELGPVKGDLAVLKTTTIPNLQTALTNVEGAAQSADKRSTVSTAAPSATTGFPQNAVWQRINDSGAVIGSWRLSGSSWVAMPLDPTVIPNLSAGIITSGVLNTDRLNAQEVAGAVGSFLELNTGQITWDNAAGNNAFIGSLVGEQAFVERLQASQISVSASNLVMFTPTLPAVLYGGVSGVTVTPRTDALRGGYYTFGGGTGTDGTLADCAHLTANCVAGDVTGRIACAPGDKFSLSARLGMSGWHGAVAGGAEARRGRIRVSFYDADNKYISGSRFDGSTANANDYGKGNLSELQATAPANARYMAVYLQSALWSSGSLTMTELRVSRSVGSVLIEDGAITADKIVANTITARELAVGAITADKAIIANSAIKSAMIAEANILTAHIDDLAVTNAKIANTTITDAKILNLDAGKITTGFLDAARIQANSIETSKLAATAIDGMTITGSTIQTSSSANTGIKIDTANGLRAWEGGNLGVQISPSIKNGIAVRNPVGEMVPLSDAAFGTVSIARSNTLSIAAPQTSGVWSAWTRHSNELDDCILTFTAVSTRYIVSWSQSWATSYKSGGSKQTGVQVGLSTGGSSNLIPSGNGGQITGLVGYLQERSPDIGDRVRSVTMQGPLSTVVGQTYTLRMYFRYQANGPGTHNISVAARTITATPVY